MQISIQPYTTALSHDRANILRKPFTLPFTPEVLNFTVADMPFPQMHVFGLWEKNSVNTS